MVLKSETLKKAKYTMMMSYIFMLTFAIYLLLTVIFIFTNQKMPVLVGISVAIGGGLRESLEWDPWIVRLFNVGTMLIYLSQTVFIMYHKGTLKVNTSKTIRSCAIHHLIISTVVSVAFTAINILYMLVNIDNPGIALYVLIGLLVAVFIV